MITPCTVPWLDIQSREGRRAAHVRERGLPAACFHPTECSRDCVRCGVRMGRSSIRLQRAGQWEPSTTSTRAHAPRCFITTASQPWCTMPETAIDSVCCQHHVGMESDWYQKPRAEAAKLLEDAVVGLQRVLAEAETAQDRVPPSAAHKYNTSGVSACGGHPVLMCMRVVLDKVDTRCKEAQGWMELGTKRTTRTAQEFAGYEDPLWWPVTKSEAKAFQDCVGEELCEIVPDLNFSDENEEQNTVNGKLWKEISDSAGGMAMVSTQASTAHAT